MAIAPFNLSEVIEGEDAVPKLNYWAWVLSFVARGAVKDRNLASPPASPTDGDAYLIADGASGNWTGHSRDLTLYVEGYGTNGWIFLEPWEGARFWVEDENAHLVYNGASWSAV